MADVAISAPADSEVSMFAPLALLGGGGLGAGAAVAAGVATVGVIGGGLGGGGGDTAVIPVVPTVNDPTATTDISGPGDDLEVVVTGTGQPGDEVEVTVGDEYAEFAVRKCKHQLRTVGRFAVVNPLEN